MRRRLETMCRWIGSLGLLVAFASSVGFGCGAGTKPTPSEAQQGEPELTKREAEARARKGDFAYDVCRRHGWYDDGTCDDWCPAFDSDCSGERDAGRAGEDAGRGPGDRDAGRGPGGRDAGRGPGGRDAGRGGGDRDGGRAPTCGAMDVEDVGPCLGELGYAYDGNSCIPLVGCKCEGSDCGEIYPDEESCERATRSCETEADACLAMDAGGTGLCARFLGYKYDGSSCVGVSGCQCEGTDCADLYDSRSDCRNATRTCSGGGTCTAMDARGEGPCPAFWGFKYDGDSCVGVGGCQCKGTDCDDLYSGLQACESAVSSCN